MFWNLELATKKLEAHETRIDTGNCACTFIETLCQWVPATVIYRWFRYLHMYWYETWSAFLYRVSDFSKFPSVIQSNLSLKISRRWN